MKDLVEPDESNYPVAPIKRPDYHPRGIRRRLFTRTELRDGLIKGMDAQQQRVSIQASLPLSKRTALASAINDLTEGRGRMDLAES